MILRRNNTGGGAARWLRRGVVAPFPITTIIADDLDRVMLQRVRTPTPNARAGPTCAVRRHQTRAGMGLG
jgi:hypothetical protein